jgi:PemK-like, MazF-like toxin of type II toxin-antitoxin system
MGTFARLARQLVDVVSRPSRRRPDRGRHGGADRPAGQAGPKATVATATARPKIDYAPVSDGDADPGEVVWTWVPYEEDPKQGKDRPVLVIGRLGTDVAALRLTSKPHDDRHHVPIGSGPWDGEGRPSWVKLDWLLQLDPDSIRREGAVIDRGRFDKVVAAFEAY